MKYIYLAVTVEQDKNESIFTDRTAPEYSPGFYAYVVKCSESDNIKSVFDRIGGLLHANIMQTRKKAVETVERWNAVYKANGTYLFDAPAF